MIVHNFLCLKGIDMPFSCFSKEIQEYTRASEKLISEAMRGCNQFSEDELQLVKYYTDEVVRAVIGHPSPLRVHELAK
jgi:hypothetical protein